MGEIDKKDLFRILGKELGVGIIVGTILAGINMLRLYYLQGMSFAISATVCTSLFFTVILANVVGGALPPACQIFPGGSRHYGKPFDYNYCRRCRSDNLLSHCH